MRASSPFAACPATRLALNVVGAVVDGCDVRISRWSLIAASVSMSVVAAMTFSVAPATAAAPAAAHGTSANRGNAAARSDLMDLAIGEETYFTDHDHYGSFAGVRHEGGITVDRGIQLTIVHVRRTAGYCLRARQASDGYQEFYDSGAGGLSDAGCSAITTGRSGGTRNGAPTAQVSSLVRDLAAAEETYLSDHSRYGSAKQLRRGGALLAVPAHVRIYVRWYDRSPAFCLKGTERTSVGFYDSRTGHIRHHCGARPNAAKSGGRY
jgi:hypothetical protein